MGRFRVIWIPSKNVGAFFDQEEAGKAFAGKAMKAVQLETNNSWQNDPRRRLGSCEWVMTCGWKALWCVKRLRQEKLATGCHC